MSLYSQLFVYVTIGGLDRPAEGVETIGGLWTVVAVRRFPATESWSPTDDPLVGRGVEDVLDEGWIPCGMVLVPPFAVLTYRSPRGGWPPRPPKR